MTREIIYLNFAVFYLLIAAYLYLTFIESITYPGYIKNTFDIELKLVLVIILFMGIFEEFSVLQIIKNRDQNKLAIFFLTIRHYLIKLNDHLLLYLFLLSSIFFFVRGDVQLYRNTIKAVINFDPLYILHFFALSLLIFVLSRLLINEVPYRKRNFDMHILLGRSTVEAILIGFLLISISLSFFKIASTQVQFIIKDPFANYDQKMSKIYHHFYYYTKFVNANTPENAVIMRMKQGDKWPWLSNDPFTRYFIYPRYTKEGDKSTLDDQEIDYVFIHKKYIYPQDPWNGERWPDFPIPAKRVLYMKDNTSLEPIIVEGDYDPNDETYENHWGIIELKKGQ